MAILRPFVIGTVIELAWVSALCADGPAVSPPRLDGTADIDLQLRLARRATSGWGTAHDDASAAGTKLRIGSQAFDRGIGTHAPAELVFDAGGKYRWLTFYAGISADMTEKGSATVQVWLDGKKARETPVLRVKEEPLYVCLPIDGVGEIRLVATDAGDGIGADHVNFGCLRMSIAAARPKPQIVPEPTAVAPPSLPAGASRLTLWYGRPARTWLESLPLGNGHLGAVVFGGVNQERLAMNEITFWCGGPDANTVKPSGKEKLAEIRRLMFAGRHNTAAGLVQEHMATDSRSYGSNLPVNDILLAFEPRETLETYRRWLDLDEAVAHTQYRAEGVEYSREVLASHPDRVLAVRLTADRQGAVSFRLSFRDYRAKYPVTVVDGRTLAVRGSAAAGAPSAARNPAGKGVRMEEWVRVEADGGTVTADGQGLRVRAADAVTLWVAVDTDFAGGNPSALCRQQIEAAMTRGYASVRERHVRDHRELFRRVGLACGNPVLKPTDARLAALRKGQPDPDLVALIFQFGRYLTIAGSREDSTLPLHLQGNWNDNIACNIGWTCDYHLDINTQQNYWLADVGNLSECQQPLFRWMRDRLCVEGRRVARDLYGARGWVAHVYSNPWGYAAPGFDQSWGMNVTGGLWAALHLWQQYQFTQDRELLRAWAYPVLKEAARFYLDYMVAEPKHGWLVTGPSNSPENPFVPREGPERGAGCLDMAPTLDVVLVRELFDAVLAMGRTLDADAGLRREVEAARAKLPPLQIGRHGQLQEWLEDHDEAAPSHRHTSHLTALYPYAQITRRRTPELARACGVSLQRRKAGGWEDAEFSYGNFVNYYARLGDGEEAWKTLNGFLASAVGDALYSYSKPGQGGAPDYVFCLDGNAAVAAGIAELLVQSHETMPDGRPVLDLLPALPRALPDGKVEGLRGRGGFEIDLEWKDAKLVCAAIKRVAGEGRAVVRCGERTIDLALKPGEKGQWDSAVDRPNR
jgi:alpha-L-fucosidase 2